MAFKNTKNMDKIVNGLKVGQLFETIDAIKENKEIGILI